MIHTLHSVTCYIVYYVHVCVIVGPRCASVVYYYDVLTSLILLAGIRFKRPLCDGQLRLPEKALRKDARLPGQTQMIDLFVVAPAIDGAGCSVATP